MNIAAPSFIRLFFGTLWRMRYHLAGIGCVFFLLLSVARFHSPITGFSSLITIGSKQDSKIVPALARVPHYVYDECHGYDGAYYVQLALHPLLDEPALIHSIDNLPYRAKRIMSSWVAWVAGLGRPAWIVQAYALLNVACWLALAFLLFRWLPLNDLQSALRWGAVLFSHGVLMSLRNSLVDLPALVAVAAAVALLECRRSAGAVTALAAATLTKETSMLAGVLLLQLPVHGWWQWARRALAALFMIAPLAVWMAFVRWRFGPAQYPGLNNFTLPLAGFVEKWTKVIVDLRADAGVGLYWMTLLCIAALTVQVGFFLARWRPADPWWRIGAVFAGLAGFVSQPVWEGYPGAATRVLLPMTLSFNMLVPRGKAWLPVLLAGNLSVLAGFAELKSYPVEFFQIRGNRADVASLNVVCGEGWYRAEKLGDRAWRWGRQYAYLKLVNVGEDPIEVTLTGEFSGITARQSRLRVRGQEVWRHPLWPDPRTMQPPPLILPPGETVLEFSTDQTAQCPPGNRDLRELSFAIYNLVIAVGPFLPAGQR